MELNQDRGTIVRITFDILYPNGQLKTVSMSMADYDEWQNSGIIAFGEGAINTIIKSGVGSGRANEVESAWNAVEEDALYKPAMLVIDNDGKIIPKCGAHHSSGHKEAGEAVARFM